MHPFVRGTSCENVELQGSENAENALGLGLGFGGGGGGGKLWGQIGKNTP